MRCRNVRSFVHASFAFLILFGCIATTEAKIRLPAIISDNMVLQKDCVTKVWGWAEPGEKIRVEVALTTRGNLAGKNSIAVEVEADKQGRWLAKLPAVGDVGSHPFTMTITDSSGEKTVVKNVLFGEVWLCSGQSNMEFPVVNCDHAKHEIAEADYPSIRFFDVLNAVADKPQDDVQGCWVECRPETVANHTAVGYFFGRELFKTLKSPVGLIQSDWGGTPAEAWTSREALESQPSLRPLLKHWDAAVGKDPKQASLPLRPANLYNAMIAPIVDYSIRGVIWYQGESNVDRAREYQTLFPTMIADWRRLFQIPEMPFGFVQIAPFNYGGKRKNLSSELREAQLLALKCVPNTGMAVTTDIGTLKNIHPTNKQEVGRRLSLWALAKVYGKQDLVYSGPIYRSMKVEGNRIRLLFDHVGGGLVSRDGKPLTCFAVAGDDHKFYPAKAVIVGPTVVVSSEAVKRPAAVRFGWSDTAEPNLMNAEGLPASPFRAESGREDDLKSSK